MPISISIRRYRMPTFILVNFLWANGIYSFWICSPRTKGVVPFVCQRQSGLFIPYQMGTNLSVSQRATLGFNISLFWMTWSNSNSAVNSCKSLFPYQRHVTSLGLGVVTAAHNLSDTPAQSQIAITINSNNSGSGSGVNIPQGIIYNHHGTILFQSLHSQTIGNTSR